MLTKMSQLHDLVKKAQNKKLAVAVAQDDNVLEAVSKAHRENVVDPILVGDESKIKKIADDNKIDISKFKLIHEPDIEKAAARAVKLVRDKEADILMKGNLGTATLLRAVLNKEIGLRKGDMLSHLAIFELEKYHKILGLADAGMNPTLDLNQKVAVINNSVDFLIKLGVEKPKVAILAAVETVSADMPATVDAAILAKMSNRKQIKNCIVDGPLAMDNAISMESVHHKGIVSDVAGDADLLITPDIEAGNILYKALGFLANSKAAALIIGAAAPIVLTSRADSDETKLNSIVMAAAVN